MLKSFIWLTCIALTTYSFQFSANAQSNTEISWQKCLGGSGSDIARKIIQANDGGYYVIGSSNSFDGDITGNKGGYDGWVVKLSNTGEMEWQRNYGGGANDYLNAATILPEGSLVCTGSTNSSVGGTNDDTWVIKLAPDGSVVWSNNYGTSSNEQGTRIIESPGGNFIISVSESSPSNSLLKIDGNGNKLGQVKSLSEIGSISGYDWPIAMDPKTGRLLVGVTKEYKPSTYVFYKPFSWIYKLDTSWLNKDTSILISRSPIPQIPAGGDIGIISDLVSTGNKDYIVKEVFTTCLVNEYIDWWDSKRKGIACDILLLSDSLLVPATGISCPEYQKRYSDRMQLHFGKQSDQFILTGYSENPSDPGYQGKKDAFWISSDNTRHCFGGSGDDYFYSMANAEGDNKIFCGQTYSYDGDAQGNHGNGDIWVVKFGSLNSIRGNVFIDQNNNGIKDASENWYSRGFFKTEKAGFSIQKTPNSGQYNVEVDTGTFITRYIPDHDYYTVSPLSRQSVFTIYGNTDDYTVGLSPIPGKKDYRISIITDSSSLIPGTPVGYTIICQNMGTDTMTNKSVHFVMDHRLNFVKSIPSPDLVKHDSLIWTVPSLIPSGEFMILVNTNVPDIPVFNIGDTLYSSALVDKSGDLFPADNYAFIRQFAAGPSKRSSKLEKSGDYSSAEEMANGNDLHYTIYFQNSGVRTAENLVIRDTLDEKLEGNSIEMIAWSHPFHFTISNDKICTWTFKNIMLLPGYLDDAASKGFISFRIKPALALKKGDIIRNTAHVLFNYGIPWVTNIVNTTMKAPPPESPSVVGMKSYYCSHEGMQMVKISNLPPEGSETSYWVMLDDTFLIVGADSTISFDISKLIIGNHRFSVTYKNYSGTVTDTSLFSVIRSVTPEVNVTANITMVINLADPVIITATNVIGGGKTPLFTFAKDRLMTSIIQAKSSNQGCTIDPSTLMIGDNWIYVRMRTSDTCYIVQTVLDSIKIERSSVTGLVDPDNPGQVIRIFPNPIQAGIQISGLSILKRYAVTVHNNYGQAVFQSTISHASAFSINNVHFASGIYIVSLYDAGRRQRIGSMKLIKN